MNPKLKQVILIGVVCLLSIGAFLVYHLRSLPIGLDRELQARIENLGYKDTPEQRAAEAAKRGIWGWENSEDQKGMLLEVLPKEEELGFAVATDFQKSLAAPMTSSQSFITVTSLTLKDGTTLSMSDLGDRVFLTLEPGATKEEIVMCTGIDATTVRFTGCARGLAFSGTSTAAVTANQKTHSSGATVVMSNVHYVYQQFLDKNGTAQYVTSTVVFNTFPAASSTTAVCSTDGQFCTKYYIDNVASTGFTSANVSSTLGLYALGTVPEKVGINISTTSSGLLFNSSFGFKLGVAASSTGGIVIDSGGRVAVDTSDALIWTGLQTFNGQTAFNATATLNGATFVNTPAPGSNTGLAANDISLNVAIAALNYETKLLISTTSTNFGSGTGENTLLTYLVPTSTLGNSNGIRAHFLVTLGSNGGGDNHTLRLKYGGTTMNTYVVTPPAGNAAAEATVVTLDVFLTGAGTTTSQFMSSSLLTGAGTVVSSTAYGTSSINSALNQNLVLTDQANNTNGSVTLRQIIVDWMR